MKMNTLFLIFFVLFASLKAEPTRSVEELKKEVSEGLPKLEGWCSQEKAMNFIDLILEIKPKVCVEIGVFGGSSVFPVAAALRHLGEGGIIIGIDPWDKIECIKYYDPIEDERDLHWWSKINLHYIYTSYISMIKKYKFEHTCVTKITTSEDAIDSFENGSIDVLYFDGNHSEVVSTKDAELYLPKVRQGGYIWFNDSLWQSRQPALDVILEQCDLVKLIDKGNCILFKKR